MFDFAPATQPTIYFIGVTTGKSSIMKVFPLWAQALGLKDAVIKGFDLPLHAPAEQYRQVVDFIKRDPLSYGALVTTHKLDLFTACRDQFDYVDPYAEKLSEVSSLFKRGGVFHAHAKDPISSGLALENFVPENFWRDHGGEVLLIGAGGSSLAMSLYFTQEKFGDNVPKRIILANRSLPRLESAKKVLSGLNPKVTFSFEHRPDPSGNDALIAGLPPYSLVVNATGLGKDAPGSPTTDAVQYSPHSLVWEINYRGDLIFMYQAQAQAKEKSLHVEDGWVYFIHGWTQVIAEVFNVPIEGPVLQQMSDIAMELIGGKK
ncbi:MAG: shikimate dehydrogenase [Oscillospiraceae bacterium]|jgi:shikimate 5-dehydrogenase|nr:shikimate dehydrogenase [Oscillospiraceae bacterium]